MGSVYDLLNQNIVWLRIFKLISLLLVGGFIGWQLFEWIYSFKKETYTSLKVQLWGWKSTLILGSALATLTPYSWAPATLNYNDVNLIVLLLIAGISISMLKKRSHNILLKSELIRFVVLGFLLGAGTFNKISSAVATLLLITPVIFFYFFDIKSILSNITALFGGFFLFWVFVHLFLVNIFSAVPKSLSLLKIIASDGYQPEALVHRYVDQIAGSIRLILSEQIILFVLCLALPIIYKKAPKSVSVIAGILFAIPAIILTSQNKYISGGSLATVYYGRLFIVSLLMYCITLGIGDILAKMIFTKYHWNDLIYKVKWFSSSAIHPTNYLRDHPVSIVLWLLIMLPLVLATGTSNDIFTVATFSNVTWLLTCIVIAFWFPTSILLRSSIALIITFGIWGTHHKIIDGYINKPYRLSTKLSKMKYRVNGLPRLDELLVDRTTAKYLRELRDIKNEARIKDGTTFLGIWDLPGEIFALGGISPGEPWYIDQLHERNIENINYSCKTGQIDKEKPPILLLSDQLPIEYSDALKKCGINFPDKYRLAGTATSPVTLKETKMFVPN